MKRRVDPALPPLLLLALAALAAMRWAYGPDGRGGALRAARCAASPARCAP